MNEGLKNLQYVIVTSDEPWSEVWHTQLHYAYQLSKRYEVIFLNPPSSWKFSKIWRWESESKKIYEHLTLSRYINFLPSFFGKFSIFVNDKLNQHLLRKKIGESGDMHGLLLWHFDPFRGRYMFDKQSNCKHIYHVIDPIAGHHLDVSFSKFADLLIITSPKFRNHYNEFNKNVIQIGQGVDKEFYLVEDNQSDIDVSISRNSILLLGTISDDIFFTLLGKLALKFPVNLVLIGPDKTVKPESKARFMDLLAIENVHWLGPMKPEDFRKHIKVCQIGIIAYDSSNNIKNNLRSPLKVISYLACFKHIISNIDCEVPALVAKGIYTATDYDSYVELIDKCFEGKLEFDVNEVNRFLESIDYNNLLKAIFSELKEPLANKR